MEHPYSLFKKFNPRQRETVYLAVIIIFLTISFIWFFKATYYISPWPTDSFYFYRHAAKRLFSLNYISDIHKYIGGSYFRVLLHGKEALIGGIAIMQKLLGDTETIFPNIVVLLLATHFSALLIYFAARKLFNPSIGFIAFLIYAACFWPYLYVLQGAHPPLAMMFLLASVLSLLYAERFRILFLLAGICCGLMLFASPAAPIYIPYYLFFWILLRKESFHKPSKTLKQRLNAYLLFASGAMTIILLFTLPRPLETIGDYFKFVTYNQYANHFFVLLEELRPCLPQNHPLLSSQNIVFRGAGLIWIIKYFFHIMPVLFSVYLAAIVYLIMRHYKKPHVMLVVLLSLSTPLAVEISRVAQFGRNYFSWLIGLLFLICFVFYDLGIQTKSLNTRKWLMLLLGIFLLAHTAFNAYIFFGDVFPTRMAMTKVDLFLREQGIGDLLVHHSHPSHSTTSAILNNPYFKNKIRFWWLHNITEAPWGYIFIPPMKGFHNCVVNEFEEDPFLTELYYSGEIEKYAIGVFPTIAASRIWLHEEEICTYRALILGQITEKDRQKGKAYILDARKLQQEWFNCRSPYKTSQLYCH